MCTGCAGRIFPFTTNAAIKMVYGMALADRAGAARRIWSSFSTTRRGFQGPVS